MGRIVFFWAIYVLVRNPIRWQKGEGQQDTDFVHAKQALSHEYRLYAFDLTDGSWTWDNKITIEREAKIIVQFDSLGPLVPRSSLTKYSDPMMREYQVDEIFTRTREAVEIQPPRKPNKTDEKRGETGAEGDKNEKRGQMRNGVRQGSLRQDKHRQRGN
jgi:hypothetical protein